MRPSRRKTLLFSVMRKSLFVAWHIPSNKNHPVVPNITRVLIPFYYPYFRIFWIEIDISRKFVRVLYFRKYSVRMPRVCTLLLHCPYMNRGQESHRKGNYLLVQHWIRCEIVKGSCFFICFFVKLTFPFCRNSISCTWNVYTLSCVVHIIPITGKVKA